MKERFRIWFAFLGGALAWTFHLMSTYALSEGFCRSGWEQVSVLGFSVMIWGLVLLTLLPLAVTSAALWSAHRLHRGSLADVRAEEGDVSLFMARSSLLNNILFMSVIVAQSFPILILGRNC